MPRSAASIPYAARALVLRTRPLGEKDRIVCLLSPERGRVDAVAKGARGAKSKLAALAQPFVIARFLLVSGRSLHIVSQAQIESVHAQLATDIFKSSWAFFCCEVAATLPEGLPDARAFEIAEVALDALERAPDDGATEAAGVWFEIQWLAHQGFAPTLGICVECGQKIVAPEDAQLWFGAHAGGTLCDDCRHADAGALRVGVATLRALHRLARSRRAPLALSAAPFELDARGAAELSACVRRSTLAHIAPKFKSATFLEELRAAKRVGLPG